jgi:hypothetical protein
MVKKLGRGFRVVKSRGGADETDLISTERGHRHEGPDQLTMLCRLERGKGVRNLFPEMVPDTFSSAYALTAFAYWGIRAGELERETFGRP